MLQALWLGIAYNIYRLWRFALPHILRMSTEPNSFYLLPQGVELAEVRNRVMLLMVLFENMHVLNSRSERRSIFRHNLWRNPFLLCGTLTAQLVHIAAMHTPGLSAMLHIRPVSLTHWLTLLGLVLTILAVMEIHKVMRRLWP